VSERNDGSAGTATSKGGRPEPATLGRLARISRYFRQVVAEMRKVVWPTRAQLITYTAVVIVFVVVFALAVLLVDLGMARLAGIVFGG
jgi:preprotein translocase subunit SecE